MKGDPRSLKATFWKHLLMTNNNTEPHVDRGDYLDLKSIVEWLTLAFIAFIVVAIIEIIVCIVDIADLQNFPALVALPEENLRKMDFIVFGVGLLSFFTFLVSAFLFCKWISQANRNLEELGAKDLEFSPGWCIGWFFIPIANWFKPLQAVKEIFVESGTPEQNAKEIDGEMYLYGWWTFWILSLIVMRSGSAFSRNIPDTAPTAIIREHYSLIITDIFLSIAAVLAIQVITRIQRRQEAKLVYLDELKINGPKKPVESEYTRAVDKLLF